MRNKYFLVASFETSDEKHAQEVEKQVANLLDKHVDDQHVSDGDVGLRAVLAGTESTIGTSETSSTPLSCDDIFDIEPDTL